MAEKKLLKVLVIHGYRQSAKSSKEKTGAFRKGLKKYLDCVFITAPNKVPGETDESDEYGWWFSKKADQLSFNASESTGIDEGHDASVEVIRKAVEEHVSISRPWIKKGPFDGILGFSQGATMVAHICSLGSDEGSPFKFKFAMLCAGFKSRSTAHEQFYKSIALPTLHVYGDTDQVIPKEMSIELAEYFTDKQIVNHKGGHFLPASSAEKKQYQEFLDRFVNN